MSRRNNNNNDNDNDNDNDDDDDDIEGLLTDDVLLEEDQEEERRVDDPVINHDNQNGSKKREKKEKKKKTKKKTKKTKSSDDDSDDSDVVDIEKKRKGTKSKKEKKEEEMEKDNDEVDDHHLVNNNTDGTIDMNVGQQQISPSPQSTSEQGQATSANMDVDVDMGMGMESEENREAIEAAVKKPEIKKLFRVHQTVMSMMQQRNYVVPYNQPQTIHEFCKMFLYDGRIEKTRMLMLCEKEADADDKVLVWFETSAKMGSKALELVLEKMKEKNARGGIIIVEMSLSPVAKNHLVEIGLAGHQMLEYFLEPELLVDITKHELVPQHVVLTKEQKNQLLTRYKLRETQLPLINLNDPIARFYGMRRGDVVKIVRSSETAGRYVTYRVCR